ncbi:glycosyltransferase family 2 protein [Candidatus Parcubacteria bacterium]|nr:glycosyltransferase family 2 protein [Candidatus Parcubacteria bacterium]
MQENPIVTISIINYNDRKFIFKAIESAVNQNYPNLDIIITDNNSTDGTREEIEKNIPKWEERRKRIMELHKGSAARSLSRAAMREDYGTNRIKYVKNTENTGFGRPHNQAFRIAKGDFVLLLNSDAILVPNYIEKALKPFADPKVGAVQGKLLRYDFDKNELYKNKENPQLNTIDTTGLMILKNRRIVCIGQGQPDKGQFEEKKEIFGADGAVPVYRKEALEDVKLRIMNQESGITNQESPDNALHVTRYALHDFEYFDENFFLYKEDVDLAWRLRLYGWKAIYTPEAVAYHGRGSGDSMAKNYIDIIKERRKINIRAKYLSFKHQRLMQIKNDFPSLLFTKHFPQFIIKELGAWAYMIIFERFLFRTLKDLYRDVPVFLKKRKMVMAKKRIGVKEMERWFK